MDANTVLCETISVRMIHLYTVEPELPTKPKMALHLLIAVQQEIHWERDTLMLNHSGTKSSCTLCLECPSDLRRREPVVLISSR